METSSRGERRPSASRSNELAGKAPALPGDRHPPGRADRRRRGIADRTGSHRSGQRGDDRTANQSATRGRRDLPGSGRGIVIIVCRRLRRHHFPARAGSRGRRSRLQREPFCPACRRAAESQPQPIVGYEIISELGRGGMGVVSLARRMSDDALIALKTAIPDVAATPEDVAKFLREARILFDLAPPAHRPLPRRGRLDRASLFRDGVRAGRDAHHLVKEAGGPLAVGRAVRLTCQMLDALAYAHARRFVHRDIKPPNL